jgi:uncharacterized pyridoxamine 5'-phosphate oxidase family protein
MDTTVAISAVGLLFTIFLAPKLHGPDPQELEGKKVCDVGTLQLILKNEQTLLVRFENTVFLFKQTEALSDMQRFITPSGRYTFVQTREKAFFVDNQQMRTVLNECKTVEV